LAIDFAVTCPVSKSQMRIESPCNDYAEVNKHRKYDVSFKGQPFIFAAVVFETLGAVNDEGQEVLKQIFRFAAKRTGCEFSTYCGRAWARFSCLLQRAVSQAILMRIISGQSSPLALRAPEKVPEVISHTHALSSSLSLSWTSLHRLSLFPLSLFPLKTHNPPFPHTFDSSEKHDGSANPPVAPSPARPILPPEPPAAEGEVVSVRGDGDCCFHLAG
jgi:hypothetical protein